ncbi:hypothetical protein Tco_0898359 [Tanacetum coccineum]
MDQYQLCCLGTFVIASSTVAGELLQEGDDKSTTEELEIKTEQETTKRHPDTGTAPRLNDEVHCDVGVHHNNRPNTPQKAIESGYHLRLKSEGGTKTLGFQNPAFQHRDSNGIQEKKEFIPPKSRKGKEGKKVTEKVLDAADPNHSWRLSNTLRKQRSKACMEVLKR